MDRWFVALGAAAAFLGVAFGAFGAHGLRGRISPEMLAIYQTGVQYHLIHALGLLFVGLYLRGTESAAAVWAGWLMVAGVMVFSGSLYALALSGVRALGAVTPLGGLCFLAAWALLGASAMMKR